jgi:hypothetical protein
MINSADPDLGHGWPPFFQKTGKPHHDVPSKPPSFMGAPAFFSDFFVIFFHLFV